MDTEKSGPDLRLATGDPDTNNLGVTKLKRNYI
jgi:hypothetical protein